jgi:serine/threonine protein kinase
MGEGRLLANRYRLDAVVGRGGMGTVWRAYDVMLDREVAVKEVELPPGLSREERDVLYERTFREARASARLNHPGVVTVHDVVEESDRPWIVMELVSARSLQDLLEEGPMEHQRVAQIGLQMLAALRHAHEKGILHRDVKPSNVLITDAGRVVLTDFGIAQVEGDSTLTQTGLVMGSPAYIPPERAMGERAVPASDLWSLGATLYAAVEGRSPYERPDAMASLQAALSEPVPPARNAGPLASVLEGLLARNPSRRITAVQAQPMLAHVATMPKPRPRPPVPPADETVTDEPVTAHYDRTVVDEAPGTVLDHTEVDPDPVTRRDPGSMARSESSSKPQAPSSPPKPQTPSQPPSQAPAPQGQQSAVFRMDQAQAPPPQEPEARTVVETEWTPPPLHGQGRQHGQVQQGPQQGQGPQTPPPWELPAQFNQWQQAPPGPSRDERARERRKTIIMVTISVILVVIAVLAGAYILRIQLNGG